MKAKHTPGQWAYVKNTSGSDTKIPPYLVLENKHYDAKNIATVIPCYGLTAEEVEANARLIAAAPDLLAAIKEAISNPRRLDKAATAYYIGQKFPITERLKVDAGWYASILSAIEKADATYNQ